MSGGRSFSLAISSARTFASSLREAAAAVLLAATSAPSSRARAMTASQRRTSSGYFPFLPPQHTSSGDVGGVRMDAGALASSHARTSLRKVSRSGMRGR